MKAVGLDTSVVLRLLMGEPLPQAKKALRYVEDCYYDETEVCVSDIVVAEVYHALIYHYDVPLQEARQTLKAFLSSPTITATGQALVVLGEYTGKGPGLVDRLIRADYLAKAPEVATFDRAFGKLPNVTLL